MLWFRLIVFSADFQRPSNSTHISAIAMMCECAAQETSVNFGVQVTSIQCWRWWHWHWLRQSCAPVAQLIQQHSHQRLYACLTQLPAHGHSLFLATYLLLCLLLVKHSFAVCSDTWRECAIRRPNSVNFVSLHLDSDVSLDTPSFTLCTACLCVDMQKKQEKPGCYSQKVVRPTVPPWKLFTKHVALTNVVNLRHTCTAGVVRW